MSHEEHEGTKGQIEFQIEVQTAAKKQRRKELLAEIQQAQAQLGEAESALAKGEEGALPAVQSARDCLTAFERAQGIVEGELRDLEAQRLAQERDAVIERLADLAQFSMLEGRRFEGVVEEARRTIEAAVEPATQQMTVHWENMIKARREFIELARPLAPALTGAADTSARNRSSATVATVDALMAEIQTKLTERGGSKAGADLTMICAPIDGTPETIVDKTFRFPKLPYSDWVWSVFDQLREVEVKARLDSKRRNHRLAALMRGVAVQPPQQHPQPPGPPQPLGQTPSSDPVKYMVR